MPVGVRELLHATQPQIIVQGVPMQSRAAKHVVEVDKMHCEGRPKREVPGGMVFHVLNRAVGQVRTWSYCLMPNHWYFVLWPEHDGDLPAFMQESITRGSTTVVADGADHD